MVIVVPFLDQLGGTQTQALSVVKRLRIEGLETTVLTCRHVRDGASPPARPDLEVVCLPVLQRGPLLDATWVVPGGSWLAVRSRAIRAVIAYQLPWAGVLAGLGRALGGPPFVAVTQCSGPHGDVAELGRLPLRKGRVRLLSRASFLASVNSAADGELAGAGFEHERIRRAANGCDCERFRPPTAEERQAARRTLSLGDEECLVAFTGRLTEQKRLPTLLAAVAALQRRVPVRLVLAGEGEAHGALARLGDTLGLGSALVFAGRLEDPRPLLHAADVFALPSASEGISLSLLEAMASGLAVVASDVSGNQDVVTSGADGLLVPCDDPDAWAVSLASLVADAALRRRLGQAARATVVGRFHAERVADVFVDWIRSLP